MTDEPKLEISPLCQPLSSDGRTVKIQIYRLEGGRWTLEVEDEFGNSTVWDDEFDTDRDALNEAKKAILEQTVSELIGPEDGKSDGKWR